MPLRGILRAMVSYLRPYRAALRVGLRLLGPVLLVVFLLRTDLALVGQTLRDARPVPVLLAVLLVGPFLVFKAWRWRLVMRLWRVDLGLGEAVAATSVGQYLGALTPGQSGDAVRAWYVRRRGVPLSVGLAGVALDRLCDLALTLPIAMLGLATWWRGARGEGVDWLWLLVAVVSAACVLAVLCWRPLRAWLWRIVPPHLRRRLAQHPVASARLGVRQLAGLALATVLGLSWTYLRIYLLCLALGLTLPVLPFVTMIALLALIGPLAPGGIGTRDALLALALGTILGVAPVDALPLALALSALILALNLENVLIGALVALRFRVDERPALAEGTARPPHF